MGGRKVWASGDILTAADVNDYLMDQSVMVFAGTAARASAIASPSEGMVTYRSDDNVVEAYTGAAWQRIGGKILQVVRATDTTSRTTTSTSFVDVTGMSVTITPQQASSAIMIIATFYAEATWTSDGERRASYRLTDSGNSAISGVQEIVVSLLNISGTGGTRSWNSGQVAIGYATPNTTSATTYKLRFRIEAAGNTLGVRNDVSTGQMFAIEVAA